VDSTSPIASELGTTDVLANIINDAQFDFGAFKGFRFQGTKFLPFPPQDKRPDNCAGTIMTQVMTNNVKFLLGLKLRRVLA
jgi:hypothetical protein